MNLAVSWRESVCTVTILENGAKNKLTLNDYTKLKDILITAAFDDNIKSVVLTGEGDYFCTGHNRSQFLARSLDDNHPITDLMIALIYFPKILIGAANGHATGFGLALLLHCDFTLAVEGVMFDDDGLENGLAPEAGMSALLEKAVGKKFSRMILLAGEAVSARDLREVWLYHLAENENDLRVKTDFLTANLAKKPEKALTRYKKILLEQEKEAHIRVIAEERRNFLLALAEPETQNMIIERFGSMAIFGTEAENAPQEKPMNAPPDLSPSSLRNRLMERRKNRLAVKNQP